MASSGSPGSLRHAVAVVLWLLPLSGAIAPALGGPASPVHEQAIDRIGHGIKRGLDGHNGAEGFPPGILAELRFEDDAPSVLVPFPAGRPGRYRRLGQHGRVSILPLPGAKLAMEYLDRPPVGHTPTIGARSPVRIYPRGDRDTT